MESPSFSRVATNREGQRVRKTYKIQKAPLVTKGRAALALATGAVAGVTGALTGAFDSIPGFNQINQAPTSGIVAPKGNDQRPPERRPAGTIVQSSADTNKSPVAAQNALQTAEQKVAAPATIQIVVNKPEDAAKVIQTLQTSGQLKVPTETAKPSTSASPSTPAKPK